MRYLNARFNFKFAVACSKPNGLPSPGTQHMAFRPRDPPTRRRLRTGRDPVEKRRAPVSIYLAKLTWTTLPSVRTARFAGSQSHFRFVPTSNSQSMLISPSPSLSMAQMNFIRGQPCIKPSLKQIHPRGPRKNNMMS